MPFFTFQIILMGADCQTSSGGHLSKIFSVYILVLLCTNFTISTVQNVPLLLAIRHLYTQFVWDSETKPYYKHVDDSHKLKITWR